jgi:hypothetical protein
LLEKIISEALPELNVSISEHISEDRKNYMAVLSNEITSVAIETSAEGDYVSEYAFEKIEILPSFFGSRKTLWSINPRLLGQDVWLFCGLEEDLLKAKNAGLPLHNPTEPFDWEAEL